MFLALLLLGLWVLAGWSLLYAPLRDTRRLARERAARLRQLREERDQLVEQLRQAEARLEEARAVPSALAGTVSRDLRGTADAMLGLSDLLCRASLPPVPARYARALRQSGSGLLALVDDLAQYAECATDPIRVTPELLRLEEVVDGARDQALARAAGRYVELPVHWRVSPPAVLLGDHALVGHALRALLADGLGRGATSPALEVSADGPGRWAFRLDSEDRADRPGEDAGHPGIRELRRTLLGRLVGALGGTWLPEVAGQPAGFILPLPAPAGLPAELECAPPPAGTRILVHGVDTLAPPGCREALEEAGLRVLETPPFAAPAETLIEAAAAERPIRAVLLVAEHADARIAPAVDACRRGAWPAAAVLLLLPPGVWPAPEWAAGLGLHGLLPWPLPSGDLAQAIGLALQRVDRGLAAPVVTPAVVAEARAMAAHRTAEAGDPCRQLHVLVVDDAEASRLVASEYLAALGCIVEQAASGPEAVDRVRLGGVDVVFLDLLMPGVDGFATARQLQELPGDLGAVPVVALTADALPAVRERCRAAGMAAHLAKPVRQEDLARVLRSVVPHTAHSAPEPGTHDFLTVARRALREAGGALREHTPAAAAPAVEDLLVAARAIGARDVCRAAGELTGAVRELDTDAAWSAHAELERAVAERVQQLREEGPLDPVRIAEYRGLEDRSPGLFGELVRIALKDLPGRVAMLGEALHAGEADAVRELAHALKGAALQIGAGRVGALARDLERMGREGAVPGGPARADELSAAWEEARSALAALPEVAQAPVRT